MVEAGWQASDFEVTEVDQPFEQLERVVEPLAGLKAAGDAERHQRAGAAAEIFLRQRIVGIVGKARVIDPGDARIGAQKLGGAARILDMALDAQRDQLDALQQEERRQRRDHRAGGALIDAAAARHVSAIAEVICIDHAVIGRVRRTELREAVGVRLPRKAAAVDNGATERGAVAAHEFGERMHDDVGAVFDRAQHHRRRHGIVDDQRDAMALADSGKRLDVADIAGGVTDALAIDGARLGVDQLFDRIGLIGFGEPHRNALARENVREQRVGGAVKLRHRNDVAAHLGEIEHRIVERGLPACDAQGIEAAFKRGDAAFEHFRRWIADAAIAVAGRFEIEQGGAVIGALEFVSDSLIDRDGDGLCCRIGLVAAVDSDCLSSHASPPHIGNGRNCKESRFLIRGDGCKQRGHRGFDGITLIFFHPAK